jgi:hypothetical protein
MDQFSDIWIYWHQGEGHAPPIVRMCISSWKRKNPRWHVHVLDRRSLDDYVSLSDEIDLSRSDLTMQKISNLVRLYLLRQHGGVWADATLFCAEPLDNWLPQYLSNGFFAFRNPGRDRLSSNWFIAADKDNVLLTELHRRYRDFFRENFFFAQSTLPGAVTRKLLAPFLSSSVPRSRLWLSWPVRKVLRIYPYYCFHYVFNAIIEDGGDPSLVWHNAKPFPAKGSHFLLRQFRKPGDLEEVRRFILERKVPVHKLHWRIKMSNHYCRNVLGYLSLLDAKKNDCNLNSSE